MRSIRHKIKYKIDSVCVKLYIVDLRKKLIYLTFSTDGRVKNSFKPDWK